MTLYPALLARPIDPNFLPRPTSLLLAQTDIIEKRTNPQNFLCTELRYIYSSFAALNPSCIDTRIWTRLVCHRSIPFSLILSVNCQFDSPVRVRVRWSLHLAKDAVVVYPVLELLMNMNGGLPILLTWIFEKTWQLHGHIRHIRARTC